MKYWIALFGFLLTGIRPGLAQGTPAPGQGYEIAIERIANAEMIGAITLGFMRHKEFRSI